MQCLGPECTNTGNVAGSGLCRAHRYQELRGDVLKPLVNRGTKTVRHGVRNANGNKQCGDCHKWLPPSAYNRNRIAPGGLEYLCRRCRTENRLFSCYGLTIAEYEAILIGQGNKCATCDAVPGDTAHAFHVDHDHACCPGEKSSCGKCVRGILCHSCNTVLGSIKEDTARLQNLIAYISGSTICRTDRNGTNA